MTRFLLLPQATEDSRPTVRLLPLILTFAVFGATVAVTLLTELSKPGIGCFRLSPTENLRFTLSLPLILVLRNLALIAVAGSMEQSAGAPRSRRMARPPYLPLLMLYSRNCSLHWVLLFGSLVGPK